MVTRANQTAAVPWVRTSHRIVPWDPHPSPHKSKPVAIPEGTIDTVTGLVSDVDQGCPISSRLCSEFTVRRAIPIVSPSWSSTGTDLVRPNRPSPWADPSLARYHSSVVASRRSRSIRPANRCIHDGTAVRPPGDSIGPGFTLPPGAIPVVDRSLRDSGPGLTHWW